MSTKTTFKRIALVAVAALGLGVLSVAPSSATVSNVAVTLVQNGTSTNSADSGYTSDSTTAAVISVSALLDNIADTVTVTFLEKSKPAGADATPYSYFLDTTTGRANSTIVDTATLGTAASASIPNFLAAGTGTAGAAQAIGTVFRVSPGSAGYVGAKFAVQLDSASARTKAGTYVYTAVIKTYNAGVLSTTTTTQDVSVVVAANSNSATTPAATKEFAVLTKDAVVTVPQVDSAVAAVSTAGTVAGFLSVGVRNAANGTSAQDSVTATITGAGLLCNPTASGTCGKSFKLASTGDATFTVVADGTAGVGTISVSTTVATFAAKTVTFYAKAAKTITASVNNPVLVVGTNDKAIKATAVDANGTAWTGTLYVYAVTAADALVGGSATTPVACSYDSTKAAHFCPVSTIAAGTASFKVIDAATVATANATSDAVVVKASAEAPASVKLAFDKATYAPYEKAIITVTPVDAAGNTLGGQTVTNIFATGGITSNIAFSGASDTLTGVTLTTSADASSTAPRTAGAYTYVVYMPAQGDVTITATGGTGLAPAGRVAVSATASVVNSSVDAATDAANEATDAANAATDAALAAADAADAATAAAQDASDAVAALSATVAKLVASLKAQITSLTNLVIKIQKKVKA